MMLRTMIVDDEPLARERLKLMLSSELDVQVVSECKNGVEALSVLRSEAIDLLFLDVQMPRLSGLEVAAQLGAQYLPLTVFVTAYLEHAVEAFNLAAVDYLTKPVERGRLSRAVQRVRDRREAKQALLLQSQLDVLLQKLAPQATLSRPYVQRLVVREGSKELFIAVGQIEWIKASDYYVALHVKGHIHLLRESISDLSSRLDPASFVRVHRSAIVNIAYLRAFYREGPEEGSVLLASGERVQTSKAGRLRLMEVGYTQCSVKGTSVQ